MQRCRIRDKRHLIAVVPETRKRIARASIAGGCRVAASIGSQRGEATDLGNRNRNRNRNCMALPARIVGHQVCRMETKIDHAGR